jgi:hypothetical protein
LTARRLLDWAALGAAGWLASALLFWSGWSASFWMRPEHVFLVLLGIARPDLVAPVAVRSPRAGPDRRCRSVWGLLRHRHAPPRAGRTRWISATHEAPRTRAPSQPPEMHAWGDHFADHTFRARLLGGVRSARAADRAGDARGRGVAVFGIARHRLRDERPAAAFALLYLVNPSLHGINVRDFHAAALAIPLLLAALDVAETARQWSCLAAILLTLTCREDAALPVLGFGAWLALGRRRWLVGAMTAVGVALAANCMGHSVLPAGTLHAPLALRGHNHLSAIAATIVLHPGC